MLTLTKVESALPDSIKLGEDNIKIKTSFRYVLRFLEVLESPALTYTDINFMYENPALIIGREEAALKALFAFINKKNALPRGDGDASPRVLDYALDADLIFAAFMQCYGINLLITDLHYYEFVALLNNIKDTKLNDIIEARTYERGGEKPSAYTKHMEAMRRAWSLPENENTENDAAYKNFIEKML